MLFERIQDVERLVLGEQSVEAMSVEVIERVAVGIHIRRPQFSPGEVVSTPNSNRNDNHIAGLLAAWKRRG